MHRLAIVCLFLPAVALADDPFACVSPEVREAFLTGYPVSSEYSTKLPIGFPEHGVPPGTSLVGSQLNETYARVVYAASANVGDAVEFITTSLARDGWIDLGNPQAGSTAGFQVGSPRLHRQLCHDNGTRILSIGTNGTEGSRLVAVSMFADPESSSCEERSTENRSPHDQMALFHEMPDLILPDDVDSNHRGSGGSGREFESHISVATDVSRDNLVALLDDQIRDQGWSFDASWTGTRSSGSSWYKESAEGQEMIGMLHSYGANSTAYNLRFSITVDNADSNVGPRAIGLRLQ